MEREEILFSWVPVLNLYLCLCGSNLDPDPKHWLWEKEKNYFKIPSEKIVFVKHWLNALFQVNYFSAQRIITPYALPLFKEEGARQKSTYRQMVKDRKVRANPIFLYHKLFCRSNIHMTSRDAHSQAIQPDNLVVVTMSGIRTEIGFY